MSLIEKISKIKDLMNTVDTSTDLILKNRFTISVDLDITKLPLNASLNPMVAYYSALVMGCAWDKYVQQVSSPVKGKILNPVKYTDLYDYVDSFENNRYIDITFVVLDKNILEAINAWMGLVYDEGFGYYDDYARYNMTLKMMPYNYSGHDFPPVEVGGIQFEEVYPVSLRFSELNHAHNNVYTVNVQFMFKTMKITSNI